MSLTPLIMLLTTASTRIADTERDKIVAATTMMDAVSSKTGSTQGLHMLNSFHAMPVFFVSKGGGEIESPDSPGEAWNESS